jgi:CheY-like chemotaxis protein
MAMRQSKDLERVPVVIMTSSAGGTRERAKAKELGAAQFITKPLELDDFLKIGEVAKQILLKSTASQSTLG